MKKVEIYHFQCKMVYGIEHVKCHRMKAISLVGIWILSELYYFNKKIQGKSENEQFQCRWMYRIKHAKCHRMLSIIPVQLWIISDVYFFNPKIHENSGNISISMHVGLSN